MPSARYTGFSHPAGPWSTPGLIRAFRRTRSVAKPRGFQRFGVVKTSRLELANDRASDRAIARVVREGLFKRRRRGRFWHLVPFGSLAEPPQVSEGASALRASRGVGGRQRDAQAPFERPVRYPPCRPLRGPGSAAQSAKPPARATRLSGG